ncbi:MAG TPA: hypothetical protein VLQ48_13650 [Chloroflexia bacterium]|nr:hypothetical protein [Chloroflexia bacterium]
MPNTFTVSTTGGNAANTITLDTARQATVTFAVTNVSGLALKARGYIVTDNASSPAWFTCSANEVRDMPAGGAEQYTYSFTVPADKPPGTYSFHFSIVGVDNPDEQFAQGPEMSYVVTAAPVRPPVKKGYTAAAVGGLVGALAGGALAALPGVIFLLTTGHITDLGEAIGDVIVFVVLAAVGALLGIWVGSAIGVWSVLRSRKYEYPGTTGCLMAVLVVILLVLSILLLGLVKLPNVVSDIVTLIVLALAVTGAALAARAITLFWRARQI